MVMETIFVEEDGTARKPQSMGRPANTAVGRGGSAEAQAWRSLRGAGPAPAGAGTPPVTPAPATGGALRTAGSAAKAVARGAAPLAAAASAAETFTTPTEDYYTRFGFDPKQDREGLTGLAKDVGVRVLGAASDLGNAFTGGLAGNLYRDRDPAVRASAGLAPQNPTLAAALGQQQGGPAAPLNPTDLRLAAGTAASPTGAPAANGITRTGNSYSGTNVLAGAEIRNPDGSVRSGPGVSSLDTSAGYAADLQQLARLRAERAEREAGFAANQPGGGLGGIRSTPLAPPANDVRQPGRSERIAAMNNATQERIAASRDALTLRGQNLDYGAAQSRDMTAQRGQDLSARSAAAAARADQMNKDRQFQLDTAKFGEEKAKTMFSQREEGQKSFNGWAETLMTTRDEKGNTVVDKGRVADFTGLVSQTMGNMITRLQQKGDPASIKKAEELAQRGLGALDAEDRALLKTLYDRRERFTQTRGIGPFSSGGSVSNDLFDYQITGKADGLVQNRLRTAGGQSIGANDLRYTEPANALLPDLFKTPTNAYGPTLREQQGLR
jgi:hypothetical protein